MKLQGVIYYYCPKENDLKDRDMLRKHLCWPTAGRVFLQIDENTQWTIPFGSTTKLINILNEVRTAKEVRDVDFTKQIQAAMQDENARKMDNRRCLRISITDADPQIDPSRFWKYLDKEKQNKIRCSDFADDSTGVFIQLDSNENYNYKKIYFSNMLDAGIKLDKMFSREVIDRIPIRETVNIPYDVED